MIRIRVVPAHSCSAITETERFKWTQILGDVVIVTTSSACKTHIMIIIPALSVTCSYPHTGSHAEGESYYLWSADGKTAVTPVPAGPRQPQAGRAHAASSLALAPSLHPPPAPAPGHDHLAAGDCTRHRQQVAGTGARGTWTRVAFLDIKYLLRGQKGAAWSTHRQQNSVTCSRSHRKSVGKQRGESGSS